MQGQSRNSPNGKHFLNITSFIARRRLLHPGRGRFLGSPFRLVCKIHLRGAILRRKLRKARLLVVPCTCRVQKTKTWLRSKYGKWVLILQYWTLSIRFCENLSVNTILNKARLMRPWRHFRRPLGEKIATFLICQRRAGTTDNILLDC